MLRKFISIKNCGNFIDYKGPLNKDLWNGTFSKVNTIYAENGSGKTTLTQIFKSLSGNECDLVTKRKSLGGNGDPEVALIDTDNIIHRFNNKRWDRLLPKIRVFDSYFAEQNVYSIFLGTYEEPGLFYDIIPNGITLIGEISELRHKRSKMSDYIYNTRSKIKRCRTAASLISLNKTLASQLGNREKLIREIEEKTVTLNESIALASVSFAEKINRNLSYFSPDLRVDKLHKASNHMVYDLYVRGHALRTKEIREIPLRHTLSEGDKSALSLSFFLAYIESLSDISDNIIVFDDPISSFDSRRRLATIMLLGGIAKRSRQFFLLSHDINFVSKFAGQFSKDLTMLKIEFINRTSCLCHQDIKYETMVGFQKDLLTLQNYVGHGCFNDRERRSIATLIRPVLEGIFRIKYFMIVKDDQWLGDFIGMVRDSDEASALYRLQPMVQDLTLLNDYSKRYHHSNPNYTDEPISDAELRTHVDLALKTFANI